MKVTSIVNTIITDVTPSMHKIRRKALNVMVSSLVSGADLTVTSLGRNISSLTTEKHQIKRSSKLCSNPHLQQELHSIYAALCHRIVAGQKQPIILIDWSDLDTRKQHFLLRAAIAVKGRSLTLLETIYPLSHKEKPWVHKAFLIRLKKMLPQDCRPVVVTDAGFRGPWFKLITSLDWDYVGRVRNRTYCKHQEAKEWHPVKTLYAKSSATAKALGHYQLCRTKPLDCQLVLYKGKAKGRHHWVANGGKPRIAKPSRVHADREKEPWLLATSLSSVSRLFAKKITKIYQSRMQIEESFRDLKTGLDFNASNTRKHHRLTVLLLIAQLAHIILYLLGLTVTLLGKHRRYQANSLKTRPVLSYQFIGLRAVKDRQLKLLKTDWQAALIKLQLLMQETANV